MAYTVGVETPESIAAEWAALLPRSTTNVPFLTLDWQQLWWQHFGGERERRLVTVRAEQQLLGLAPLLIEPDLVHVAGDRDVCDYLDFIVDARHEEPVLAALLEYLNTLSWKRLLLQSLPGKSPTLARLQQYAPSLGWSLTVTQEDVCPRMPLPGSWDAYLATLSKKDRHELRRKLRRLGGAGDVAFREVASTEGLDAAMDDFLRLHRESREDKADFMNAHMEEFFRQVITCFVGSGMGKLFFLDVNAVRTAAVFCFDYEGRRLLYNSGYDLRYSHLSVGLLLKAMTIENAIEAGMTCYDFLRGNEPYKYDLGGIDSPIYQCMVERER